MADIDAPLDKTTAPIVALTIHTALAIVLGTRWDGSKSIVPNVCGHGDRVSQEVDGIDAPNIVCG